MPLPSSLAAYTDVRAIIDAAIAKGGAIYYPPPRPGSEPRRGTPGEAAARHWQLRARTFRRIARQAGEIEYATIDFALEGEGVRIFQPSPGLLVDLSGEEVSVPKGRPLPEIDLDALREEFKRK